MFAANGVWGHFEISLLVRPNPDLGWSDVLLRRTQHLVRIWRNFGCHSHHGGHPGPDQSRDRHNLGQSQSHLLPDRAERVRHGWWNASRAASCNSSGSGGPAAGCAFNDVTQGDIDLACEYNGTTDRSTTATRPTSGTYGVDSTDNVTGCDRHLTEARVIPPRRPAPSLGQPTVNPYKSPTGTTLWAGGTQATCTAAVNAGSTTAVWTVAMASTSGSGRHDRPDELTLADRPPADPTR